MRVKVPGNLLLLGEYAVTMPGGLGIAVAVDRYLTIDIEKSSHYQFSGFDDDSLVRHILGDDTNYKIHIDSSEFYENGQKLGFGSSAAITVGLLYALHGDDILEKALGLHRSFQGGGSGYDILASLYGGAALFTGGDIPSWQPLSPSFSLSLQCNKPERTPKFLPLFEKLSNKQKFKRLSNQIVCSFTDNPKKALKNGARLNAWVHRAMGCPVPYNSKQKWLGAGSELALSLEGKPTHGISKRGVQ